MEKVKRRNKQSVNYKSEKIWLQTCLEPWTSTTNLNIKYILSYALHTTHLVNWVKWVMYILYMIKTNVVFLLVVGDQSFKMFGAKLCPYKSILSFPFALWLLPPILAISKKTFMAALFLVIELLITRQGKSSWIFFFFF